MGNSPYAQERTECCTPRSLHILGVRARCSYTHAACQLNQCAEVTGQLLQCASDPPQERIRAQHRELLKAACGVFESQRVCEFLVLGLQSKNNRTRTEAIEVLTSFRSLRCFLLSMEWRKDNPVCTEDHSR